jgi:CRP-like cAMP-binding protein
VLLDILKKMEVFGDISFLRKGKASASVIANSKRVRLYVLESEFISRRLQSDPRLAAQFYEYLCKRLSGRLRVVNQL